MNGLKVLELYSGIGGMHCAFNLSGIPGEIIAAVDINHNANMVYKHNFKDTKVLQKTIEGIKLEEYNNLDFNCILMSPPCQPFSRQGNQAGSSDNRAQSFLTLIEIIPKIKKKPKFILMENVRGFDQDEARNVFIRMLKQENYYYQEFLLSPIQFGIPNSRLRYFLIARLNEPFTFDTTNEISTTIPSKAFEWIDEISSKIEFDLDKLRCELNSKEECYFTENLTANIKESQINDNYQNCVQAESKNVFTKNENVRKLEEFVVDEMGHDTDLYLTRNIFLKSLKVMDLVTVNSTRTNCFTKNYGRYLEGTGSLLKVNSNKIDLMDVIMDKTEHINISKNLIRFFSPKEIANLHCFPDKFEFPNDLTTLQKWKCIGNSLNVFIVGILIKLMVLD
ncbi:tRNA (cytosine(38)-C(5))-methyltransferase [Brachionus plicatilis]|uniref:Cytosine-specific methyltransferase n=1 Tax=Brachionus plicatilis TaxID=10195 RepID=A0A3M7QBQ1_BRAPC|nr:tRNA (cytosine(38)-C(5))-methyltransferase [Brachionus plicatilis]